MNEIDVLKNAKPCPFCGKSDLALSTYEPQENEVFVYFTKRYAVKCDYNDGGCGVESGHFKYLDELLENWNKRVKEVSNE